MSLLPAIASVSSAPFARARIELRGAGNANHSRTLDGEDGRPEHRNTGASGGGAARHLSRSGTESGAPLWNGPWLRPAFVAQVLGQVMMEDGSARVAPGYRDAAQVRPGALYDGNA
jgi:hypothetical protein